jgi:hypothetical protein
MAAGTQRRNQMPHLHQRRLRSLQLQLRQPRDAATVVGASGGVVPITRVSPAPFVPAAALAGGLVLPLWPHGSPFIENPRHEDPKPASRVHEPEQYNPNSAVPTAGTVDSVRGVHNPSMEVHAASRGRESH